MDVLFTSPDRTRHIERHTALANSLSRRFSADGAGLSGLISVRIEPVPARPVLHSIKRHGRAIRRIRPPSGLRFQDRRALISNRLHHGAEVIPIFRQAAKHRYQHDIPGFWAQRSYERLALRRERPDIIRIDRSAFPSRNAGFVERCALAHLR